MKSYEQEIIKKNNKRKVVWTVQTIVFSGWISLKLVEERCVVCSIRFIISFRCQLLNGKLNPTGFFKLTVDLEVQKLKQVPVHYITCHKLECCKEEWSYVNRKRAISGWRNHSLFLFGWTHERDFRAMTKWRLWSVCCSHK